MWNETIKKGILKRSCCTLFTIAFSLFTYSTCFYIPWSNTNITWKNQALNHLCSFRFDYFHFENDKKGKEGGLAQGKKSCGTLFYPKLFTFFHGRHFRRMVHSYEFQLFSSNEVIKLSHLSISATTAGLVFCSRWVVFTPEDAFSHSCDGVCGAASQAHAAEGRLVSNNGTTTITQLCRCVSWDQNEVEVWWSVGLQPLISGLVLISRRVNLSGEVASQILNVLWLYSDQQHTDLKHVLTHSSEPSFYFTFNYTPVGFGFCTFVLTKQTKISPHI